MSMFYDGEVSSSWHSAGRVFFSSRKLPRLISVVLIYVQRKPAMHPIYLVMSLGVTANVGLTNLDFAFSQRASYKRTTHQRPVGNKKERGEGEGLLYLSLW